MKIIDKYICEICNEEYDNLIEAMECEDVGMEKTMTKFKKVNYSIRNTRYWTCPNCSFMTETDVFHGIDVFPQCDECGKKFIWGEEGDTLEKIKIDNYKMEWIEKGASIEGSVIIFFGIILFAIFIVVSIVSKM